MEYMRERLGLKEGDIIEVSLEFKNLKKTCTINIMKYSSLPKYVKELLICNERKYVYGENLSYGSTNPRFGGWPIEQWEWEKVNHSNKKCPLCNSCGEDLVFAFYCSNQNCKNYRK